MTLPSSARVRYIADNYDWHIYYTPSNAQEMRTVAGGENSSVLIAKKSGGKVMLGVRGGQVASGVNVGPFRLSSEEEGTWRPTWVGYDEPEAGPNPVGLYTEALTVYAATLARVALGQGIPPEAIAAVFTTLAYSIQHPEEAPEDLSPIY